MVMRIMRADKPLGCPLFYVDTNKWILFILLESLVETGTSDLESEPLGALRILFHSSAVLS